MDKKMKHLEMIERIIERMGSNSFKLKGWTVTLVTISGALSAYGSDKRFFLLTLIPVIAFWFLDSFYLQSERKYSILYKNVVTKSEDTIDFNMDTQTIVCSVADAKRIDYIRCLFSKTEWPFYLIIAGTVAVLAIIIMQ